VSGSLFRLPGCQLEFGSTVRVVEQTTLFRFDDYVYQENSPMYDVSRDGQTFLLLRRERADTENDPVVVFNWMTEVERLMREQGGR